MYDGGEPDTSGIELEQALLGILMYDAEALEQIGPHLQGAHFTQGAHRWLFDQIRATAARGDPPDAVLLHAREPSLFKELGGIRYLADLIDRAPPTPQASQYANALFEAAQRKHVIALCMEFLEAAREFRDIPAFEIVAELRQRAESLEGDAAPPEEGLQSIQGAALAAIQSTAKLAQEGRPRGAMTGLRCFDRRLGGLLPGKLVIIGGRPGMGKSGLLRAALHGAAVRNPNDLFVLFSLEMSEEEMSLREMSAISHELSKRDHGEAVPYENMLKGKVTPFDLQMMDAAAQDIPPNFIIEYAPKFSVEDWRRKLWALKRRGRVRACGVDYLQIMTRPDIRGRTDAAILGDMTSTMKRTSGELGMCTLLASQINRGVETRDDKKPTLADLRESGAIEQDADAVLFPYREFYYLQGREPKGKESRTEHDMRVEETRNLMEVICAKWRSGAIGSDMQTYLAPYDYIADKGE